MKIDRLHIENFKNLKKVTVDFDESSLVNVLLGWNGTGKSNLLESLVLIFRNIDLKIPPVFKFEIEYICRSKKVKVNGEPGKSGIHGYKFEILIKGEWSKISYSSLISEKLVPEHVFGYYSGPSDRLSDHFQIHQSKFYKALLEGEDKPLRPFFYARTIHSQFVLLSFFIANDKHIKDFLYSTLGIVGLESVLFILNKPGWKSTDGDPRFWNARGVVQTFLNNLMNSCIAPIRLQRRVDVGFRKKETKEFLYMFLKDQKALEELRDLCVGSVANKNEKAREFFKLLESTYISELLEQVQIRVKVKNSDDSLTFRELSEGEQQLLTVLGLLRFTGNSESLFLLDEPDTHINPSWSVNYIEHLKNIGGLNEFLSSKKQSHVIMATHNPIVLAGLPKEQVHILKRDEKSGDIYSETPVDDPKGLGVSGILTSDMFGLRSDLDIETQDLLDEHARLLGREKLSKKDAERLEEISKEMETLGFLNSHSNPNYDLFLKAMSNNNKINELNERVMSKKEKKEVFDIANNIFKSLKKVKVK